MSKKPAFWQEMLIRDLPIWARVPVAPDIAKTVTPKADANLK